MMRSQHLSPRRRIRQVILAGLLLASGAGCEAPGVGLEWGYTDGDYRYDPDAGWFVIVEGRVTFEAQPLGGIPVTLEFPDGTSATTSTRFDGTYYIRHNVIPEFCGQSLPVRFGGDPVGLEDRVEEVQGCRLPHTVDVDFSV